MDEHLIDKRVIQKHINKGKVDSKEYNRLLAALPDLSDRVVRGSTERVQAESSAESKPQAEPAGQASVGG